MSHLTDPPQLSEDVTIRRARPDDLQHVSDLDDRITGQAKPDYWQDIFDRYAARKQKERFFLVADDSITNPNRPVLGFVVGEVREWEFGSKPCGWVFAVSVEPEARERGIGTHLFQALADEFRAIGINTMRTMVQHQNPLHMAFFRGEGMVAGPYIQLEMTLDV